MVDVWLPYGKTEVCVRIPARNFLGSIEPKERSSAPDVKVEIERALREPIGSKRLSAIAGPEHKIAIVLDDPMRQGPTDVIVLSLLDELKVAGAKDENATIILAYGMHGAAKREEALKLLGEEVLNRVKVIGHDRGSQELIDVGRTSRHGTRVCLNRVFAEADVKILVGSICLSDYVGYSGGGEKVISGISGEETVTNGHAMFLDSNAKTGILEGNPVHDDITEAARLAKVNFILNVVTNSKREIVKAFAGDLEQAFMEGVKLVDDMYRIEIDRRADVVVVSPGGYPSDASLYEAWDGVDNALEAVKRGGVIVLVAECPEGHGDETFYDWMARFGELKIVEREIKRNFILGGHKACRLLHALQNHQIILVSSMPDYYASNVFKLKTARATNDALNEAFNIAGKNAKVWTMPYGAFMLPEIKVVEEQNVSVSN